MIYKENCYTATCDNCGETYQNEHSGFSMYSTDQSLLEEMDNDDWYLHDQDTEHQDKEYCPKCFKWHPDIDDKIILDESRKKTLPTKEAEKERGWTIVTKEAELVNKIINEPGFMTGETVVSFEISATKEAVEEVQQDKSAVVLESFGELIRTLSRLSNIWQHAFIDEDIKRLNRAKKIFAEINKGKNTFKI